MSGSEPVPYLHAEKEHEEGIIRDLQNEKGMDCLNVATEKKCLDFVDVSSKDVGTNCICTPKNRISIFGTYRGYSALHFNAQNGNEKVTQLLLSRGANVNIKDINGNVPLHVAATYGYQQIVQVLLMHGSNPNEQNKILYTPLHFAVDNGHTDIVKLLVISGGSIHIADKCGNTVLLLACKTQRIDIVEFLLTIGSDVNAQNNNGETALHIAAECGCLDMVQLLLKANAKTNLISSDGDTALLNACRVNKSSVVEVLIKYGSDVNHLNKQTPLHCAVKYECVETVKVLLESGAKVDAVDKYGKTVLIIACGLSSLKIVQLLVDHGSNVNFIDNNIFTALQIAAKHGSAEIVELLLKSGSFANFQDEFGNTALHLTCQNCCYNTDINDDDDVEDGSAKCKKGYVQTIEHLLSYGCNINIQNLSKLTALHVAAENGCAKIVEVLLRSGSKVDLCDVNGSTALHYACRRKNVKIVQSLLSFGFSVNFYNNRAERALHTAIKNSDTNVIKALIGSGALVNVYDIYGVSPLHYACKRNDPEVVKLLIKHDCNINFVNNFTTALHIAANYCCGEIVETLIQFGADIDFINVSTGNSALHIACENNNVLAVYLLLHYGCNATLRNKNNYTPLHIAAKNLSEKAFHLLLDHNMTVEVFESFSFPSDEFAVSLLEHVLKLQVAGFCNARETLTRYSISKEFNIFRFMASCGAEIRDLKELRFKNTCISVYDVMRRNKNGFATCLRNYNIYRGLKEIQKFNLPIYNKMIQYRFVRGARRKMLLENCRKCFDIVFNDVPKLPYECIDIILSELCDNDLIAISDACQRLKNSRWKFTVACDLEKLKETMDLL